MMNPNVCRMSRPERGRTSFTTKRAKRYVRNCLNLGFTVVGKGIIKGMAARRGISSEVTSEERLITVQYPEERAPLPEELSQFSVSHL